MGSTHVPNVEPCEETTARQATDHFVRTTNTGTGTTLHLSHGDSTFDNPIPMCGDDRADRYLAKELAVYPEGSKKICRVCRKLVARRGENGEVGGNHA